MKILVLGSLERARDLLRGQRDGMRQFFHCPKDIRVTRSFSPIDPPDWILIEEGAMPREGMPLLQSLRTMDFYTNSGRHEGSAAATGPAPAGIHPGVCRLERDAQGVMRLHCGLQQTGRRPPQQGQAGRAQDPDQGEAAICFEYQAPLPRRSS
jgi:hypothetical protein